MKALTINDLAIEVSRMLKAGLGKKKILLPSDDEGNEFHELFCGFTESNELPLDDYQLPYGVSMEDYSKDYIILG